MLLVGGLPSLKCQYLMTQETQSVSIWQPGNKILHLTHWTFTVGRIQSSTVQHSHVEGVKQVSWEVTCERGKNGHWMNLFCECAWKKKRSWVIVSQDSHLQVRMSGKNVWFNVVEQWGKANAPPVCVRKPFTLTSSQGHALKGTDFSYYLSATHTHCAQAWIHSADTLLLCVSFIFVAPLDSAHKWLMQ